MARKKKRPATRCCKACMRHFVPEDKRKKQQLCPYCGELTGTGDTRSSLTKRADQLFSKLIRYAEADQLGNVRCVTCGAKKKWDAVDCGHYMSRSFKATRWDWDNCWPQCKPCNSGFGQRHWRPNDSIKIRYTKWLRENVGPMAPEELHHKALTGHVMDTSELREFVWGLEAMCRAEGLI